MFARVKRGFGIALSILSLALPIFIAPVAIAPSANAASLEEVQARVRQLEEEATTAAEGAQEAKVKLASLSKTLAGIQAQEQVQGAESAGKPEVRQSQVRNY